MLKPKKKVSRQIFSSKIAPTNRSNNSVGVNLKKKFGRSMCSGCSSFAYCFQLNICFNNWNPSSIFEIVPWLQRHRQLFLRNKNFNCWLISEAAEMYVQDVKHCQKRTNLLTVNAQYAAVLRTKDIGLEECAASTLNLENLSARLRVTQVCSVSKFVQFLNIVLQVSSWARKRKTHVTRLWRRNFWPVWFSITHV